MEINKKISKETILSLFFPDDIILYFCLLTSAEKINILCLLDAKINELIYNNNNFWKNKFIYDFDFQRILVKDQKPNSWMNSYNNFGNITVFGNNCDGQSGIIEQN